MLHIPKPGRYTAIVNPVLIFLFTSHFMPVFFLTKGYIRIGLFHQEETECQSDASLVAKQHASQSNCLSTCDTLWQASQQADPFGTEEH